MRLDWIIGGVTVLAGALSSKAAGLDRGGFGARSMGMAGADAALTPDSLSSLGANPAGLAYLAKPEVDLGFVGGLASGTYDKAGLSHGHLTDAFGATPEAAFSLPLGERAAVGISFIPDSLLLADWKYNDAPGGLGGISYGLQEHRSELLLFRSALGAAIRPLPNWSLGASVGLLYNENRLLAPYIFQDLQPTTAAAVNGAKTLLDLQTSGVGWNVQVGTIYAPLTNLQFGLTYKTEAEVSTDGAATGDPYAQFGAAPGLLAFRYDANVRNTFPQEITGGVSWKPAQKWRLALEIDWIDWSRAFKTLPVRLENGDNPTVNAVLGENAQDNIPLNWRDSVVYRAGIEYAITGEFFVRAGYAYGRSPVPGETLTPLTAVIMEQTVSAGFGYAHKGWGVDVAWQYDLPVTREISASSLRSGEYSNSSVDVSIHRLAVTGRYRF